jgi:hypothetical protein
MNKEFVSYELAVKLKELGYDEPCVAYFTYATERLSCVHNIERTADFHTVRQIDLYINYTLAPLWQQAFDWMYEKHHLWAGQFINIHPDVNKIIYSYRIYEIKPDSKAYGGLMVDGFDWTPEEMRKSILTKMINKLKNNE